MTISVRHARLTDARWLFEQLLAFDKFANYKRSLMEDKEYARQALETLITGHVAYVAERNGAPLGFIAGYRTPHPFNPLIKVLTEVFWWVTPENRGGRAGLLLLKEFEKFGYKFCDWIVFTLEHHSPVRNTTLLKRGYKFKEQAYLLEV